MPLTMDSFLARAEKRKADKPRLTLDSFLEKAKGPPTAPETVAPPPEAGPPQGLPDIEEAQLIPVPEEYGLEGERKLAYQMMRLQKRRAKAEAEGQVLTGGRFFKGAARVAGGMVAAPGMALGLAPRLGEEIAGKPGRALGTVAKWAGYFSGAGVPMLLGEAAGGVLQAVGQKEGASAGQIVDSLVSAGLLIALGKLGKAAPALQKAGKVGAAKLVRYALGATSATFAGKAGYGTYKQSRARGKSHEEALADAAIEVAGYIGGRLTQRGIRKMETRAKEEYAYRKGAAERPFPRGKVTTEPARVAAHNVKAAKAQLQKLGDRTDRTAIRLRMEANQVLRAARAGQEAARAAAPREMPPTVKPTDPRVAAATDRAGKARREARVWKDVGGRVGRRRYSAAKAAEAKAEAELKAIRPERPEPPTGPRRAAEIGLKAEREAAMPRRRAEALREAPKEVAVLGAREAKLTKQIAEARQDALQARTVSREDYRTIQGHVKALEEDLASTRGYRQKVQSDIKAGRRTAEREEITTPERKARRARIVAEKPEPPVKALEPAKAAPIQKAEAAVKAAEWKLQQLKGQRDPEFSKARVEANFDLREANRALTKARTAAGQEVPRIVGERRPPGPPIEKAPGKPPAARKGVGRPLAPGKAVRVPEPPTAPPKGPLGYAEVQAKVPPGMPGGVIGQPQTAKQFRAIMAIRRKSGLKEAEYRGIVREVSGQERTRTLDKAQSSQVLTRLGAAAGPPTKPGKPVTGKPVKPKVLRKPAPEEAPELKRKLTTAIKEVQTRHKVKHPEVEGVSVDIQKRRPGLLRRAVGTLQASHETKMEETFGGHKFGPKGKDKVSAGYDLTIEAPRAGRSKEHRSRTSFHGRYTKGLRAAGITNKDMRAWSNYVEGAKPKQRTVKLRGASVKSIKANQAELLDIYLAAQDPDTRPILAQDGWLLPGTTKPVRFGSQAIADIGKALDPRIVDWVHSYATQEVGQISGPMFATARWQEKGAPLKIHPGYMPRSASRIHTAERRVKADLPEQQMAAWSDEIARQMGAKVKAKPPGRGLMARGMRRAPQVGDQPHVKPRTGGVPLEGGDGFMRIVNFGERAVAYDAKWLPAQQARALIYSTDWLKAMRERFPDGDSRVRDAKQWLAEFEAMEVPKQTALSAATGRMIRKAHVGILPLRPQTIAIQSKSYIPLLADVPLKHWLKGLKGFVHGASDARFKTEHPEIYARFQGDFHQLMTPSLRPEGKAVLTRLSGGKPGGIIGRAGMKPLRWMDKHTIKAVHACMESWAKADGYKGGELIAETNKRLMWGVDRTQPSAAAMSLGTLQRQARGRPVQKMFMMFTNAANKSYNVALRAINEYRTGPGGLGSISKMMGKVALSTAGVGTAIYFTGYAARRGMGYDKKKFADHMEGIVGRALGGAVIVGPLATTVGAAATRGLTRRRFWGKWPNLATQNAADVALSAYEFGQAYEMATREAGERARRQGKYPAWERKMMSAAMRAGSVLGNLTGVPVSGAVQIARPHLRPPEPPTTRLGPPRR